MIDYYLKFKDQAEAEGVLFRLSFLTEMENEDGSVIAVSTGLASIDFIGVIYKPTGNFLKDFEGDEYPEFSALEGYHINLRTLGNNEDLDLALRPYIQQPTTPVRVWA